MDMYASFFFFAVSQLPEFETPTWCGGKPLQNHMQCKTQIQRWPICWSLNWTVASAPCGTWLVSLAPVSCTEPDLLTPEQLSPGKKVVLDLWGWVRSAIPQRVVLCRMFWAAHAILKQVLLKIAKKINCTLFYQLKKSSPLYKHIFYLCVISFSGCFVQILRKDGFSLMCKGAQHWIFCFNKCVFLDWKQLLLSTLIPQNNHSF